MRTILESRSTILESSTAFKKITQKMTSATKGSRRLPTESVGGKKLLIEQYDHKDETRGNNPPVSLVTAGVHKETGKRFRW